MRKCALVLSLLGTFGAAANAAGEMPIAATAVPASLKEAAQKAVLYSPEVTAKWYNYKAADEEIGVARGGYFPRVDLTAGAGRESLKQPPLGQRDNYNRSGYALGLTQMLFDGFATRNEVRRLNKAKLVRYYELLDASEGVALEAGRAYLDVLRYRKLNELAEDNYVQHKATHEQLVRRTQSGVGRRVDLEQAGSRLALAEVNLATESANLHDVSARYQRLVNSLPPANLAAPNVANATLPGNAKGVLESLYKKNPTLLATVENIEAADYDIDVRRAAFSPKLDFRARTESTDNYLGARGDRDFNVAEIVLSYNLFNGGSDRARERQYVERRNIALEQREKACRDTRQTALIAYNDVQRLREQLGAHQQQVSLLEKTRDAYRDQYNIGQRTLLDLLDTENELLAARRSAVNADIDLSLAHLRTLAGIGTLLEYLGLQRLDAETPADGDVATLDVSKLCPNDPVQSYVSNRDSLNGKAQALNASNAKAAPVPMAAMGDDAAVEARVKAWADAWMAKDYPGYMGFYAQSFAPDGGLSREDWAHLRKGRLSGRQGIKVDLQDIKVKMDGKDRAFADFRQVYQSNAYRDSTQKTLEMIKVDGKWLINRESSTSCLGNTVGGCKGALK